MQFNSYIFLLLFLPATLFLYFNVCSRHPEYSRFYLLAVSGILYAYSSWKALSLILILAIVNYCLCRKTEKRRFVLVAGIFLDIFVLGYFKYANFLIDNVNAVTGKCFTFRNTFLPLGISFITFQLIAVLVTSYRGTVHTDSLTDFLLYVFYFPKISEGPICEYQRLTEQFHDSRNCHFQVDHFFHGICLLMTGLAKKILLADPLVSPVNWGFGNIPYATAGDLFIVMLCTSLQLYFDFSGYSDMAKGISEMFNIEIPANFNSPYKAANINDFWKRWHISLTDFLRKYIYFPLGGSKKGKVRTYINILIVFLVSGIWHGAAWTYIAWGFLHGMLCCFERIIHKKWKKLPVFLQWIFTFLCVNIITLLLRADSIGQWILMTKKLVRMYDFHLSADLISSFSGYKLLTLSRIFNWNVSIGMIIVLVIRIAFCLILCLCTKNTNQIKFKASGLTLLWMLILAFLSILSLGNTEGFIYNGF